MDKYHFSIPVYKNNELIYYYCRKMVKKTLSEGRYFFDTLKKDINPFDYYFSYKGILPKTDILYIYEGILDVICYGHLEKSISFYKKFDGKIIELLKNYKNIIVYVDNDIHGIEYFNKINKKFKQAERRFIDNDRRQNFF